MQGMQAPTGGGVNVQGMQAPTGGGVNVQGLQAPQERGLLYKVRRPLKERKCY